MPGMAAGPEIFENLSLPKENYELHFLRWLKPLDLDETITNYTMRLNEEIKHENPVLIGVSFGGMIVQEMSRFINCKKIIIISSVKSKNELPIRYKIADFTGIYALFPTKLFTNFEDYTKFLMGKSLKKKARDYKKYLPVRDEMYLKWSIKNVLKWKQNEPSKNLIHIHGTDDSVFPIKHIKNAIEIPGGTHAMILNKAKIISEIINQSLTC